MTMLISMVFMVSSCSDDDTGGGALSYGKVTGVVTDDLSSPLEGVTVLVDGSGITATPDGPQATTNSQGVYTLENISIGTHIITFTKADYQTVSVTVVAGKFNEEQVAEVSPKMEYAAAKIKGKVTDAGKGSAPLEGVTVSISSTQTTTTGSDGTFEIGNLPLADYTVTFTKDGYASIVKKVVMADFVDGIATTDVRMGGTEILRGLTIDDLKAAENGIITNTAVDETPKAIPIGTGLAITCVRWISVATGKSRTKVPLSAFATVKTTARTPPTWRCSIPLYSEAS